jgi:polyisoprenoid-binding protein YceI
MKTTWKIDAVHSDVQFKIKHMMISTVTGAFKEFDAEMVTEGDTIENASVSFSAKIDSIDTRNEQRDGHLKSDDFFNAEKFPELSFSSTSIIKVGDDFKLVGNLTIRDITKEVQIDAVLNGIVDDMEGKKRAGFDLTGKISRKEFGLLWNGLTETGGVVVSDEVRLVLNIQMVKQD